MPDVLVGLGGNVGDVAGAFHTALTSLGRVRGLSLQDVSAYSATRAVDTTSDSSNYLNAAALFETSLPPVVLLDLLQDQEAKAGRVRDGRWGPRPLDLDLLFYGDQVIESEDLIVPHPAAWYRRFVLDSAVKIAPHFVHPMKRLTLQELRERLLARPLTLGLAGPNAEVSRVVFELLLPPQTPIQIQVWTPRDPYPTLLLHLDPEACRREVPYPLVRWWPFPSSEAEFLRAVCASALGPDYPTSPGLAMPSSGR